MLLLFDEEVNQCCWQLTCIWWPLVHGIKKKQLGYLCSTALRLRTKKNSAVGLCFLPGWEREREMNEWHEGVPREVPRNVNVCCCKIGRFLSKGVMPLLFFFFNGIKERKGASEQSAALSHTQTQKGKGIPKRGKQKKQSSLSFQTRGTDVSRSNFFFFFCHTYSLVCTRRIGHYFVLSFFESLSIRNITSHTHTHIHLIHHANHCQDIEARGLPGRGRRIRQGKHLKISHCSLSSEAPMARNTTRLHATVRHRRTHHTNKSVNSR